MRAVRAELQGSEAPIAKLARSVNRRGNLPPYWRRMLTPVWDIDPTVAERRFGVAAVGLMAAVVRRGS